MGLTIMNKKTYIQPNMVVKNVAPQSMIAESVSIGGNYDGKSDIEVKSSRFDDWDDEW